MKIKMICTVAVGAVFMLCAGLKDGAAQEAWKLKKKKDGIEVYVRSVPGSKLDEFRGVMRIADTRLSSLLAAFDDTPSYTRWMHECIEARLLKKISLFERFTYTVTRAPWPVWNRDMVSHSIIRQDPATLAIAIRLEARADQVPPREKMVRVPMMRGLWTFTPLESGEIMVVYQMHSDPGGSLPPGLANMAVVDLPYYTLVNLRKIVREERYVSAVIPQIKEPEGRK
ncbi:MAG: hypothetical protein E4G96_09765 [Chrysiogenales bacterium]|nr:MAG: hypothetical protein E4G96_09765 [Chrysiogenales bacterium]